MPFSVAYPLAVLVAGTIASLTDWLFMGVLFHSHYNDHPEVWRPGIAEGKETSAIILSAAIGYVMTAGVLFLCGMAGSSLEIYLVVAGLVWFCGSLPILVINTLFIKMDWHVLVAHSSGYLARMLIAGVAAGWLYGSYAL